MSTAAENFLRRHLPKSWTEPGGAGRAPSDDRPSAGDTAPASGFGASRPSAGEPGGDALTRGGTPPLSFSGFGLPNPPTTPPTALEAEPASPPDPSAPADVAPPMELDLLLDLGEAAEVAAPLVVQARPTAAVRVDLDIPLETVPAILWRSDLHGTADTLPGAVGTALVASLGSALAGSACARTGAGITPSRPAGAAAATPPGDPASRWQGALDTTLAKAWAQSQRVAVLRIASERLMEAAAALGPQGEALVREAFGERLQALLQAPHTPELAEHLSGARLHALPDAHLIVLPGLRSANVAEHLARRCIEALARPVALGELRLSLPAAVGISMFPHDGQQTPALLRTAEVAWRHACQRGRSGYQFYAQEMEARSLRRLTLEAAFRDALVDSGVQLSFLPRVSLRTGALCGAEVQLQWTALDGATLDTAGVLSFAEETDQSETLAHWLLARACEQLQAWSAAGLGAQQLTLPVLPSALRRSYSVQRLHEILYDHGIGLGQIVLMLCPVPIEGGGALGAGTASLARQQEARDWALRLEPLRDAGFGLAIDAVASSAGAMAVLRQLPLSEYRLDAQVLDSLDDDAGSLAQSAIDLGHRLGLRVIVTGVSTDVQLERLRRQGADSLQGEVLSDALSSAIWAEVLLGARPLAHPWPHETTPSTLGGGSVVPRPTAMPSVPTTTRLDSTRDDSTVDDGTPSGCDISLHLSTDLAA